ncbi:hypothetical protein LR48_Vigan02g272000 [Vigna angularis]|uniref:Uncharacterized protein n=1 Tax=Phaseolus angularis TaxID=3914 RepID=A0A0L9U1B2_PHAAN|nr:hypothetical protein LR48_Vigan02g272000 [Vigna angularis]
MSFHEALTPELGRNDLHVEVGLLVGTSSHGSMTRVLGSDLGTEEFADENRDKYWRSTRTNPPTETTDRFTANSDLSAMFPKSQHKDFPNPRIQLKLCHLQIKGCLNMPPV